MQMRMSTGLVPIQVSVSGLYQVGVCIILPRLNYCDHALRNYSLSEKRCDFMYSGIFYSRYAGDTVSCIRVP